MLGMQRSLLLISYVVKSDMHALAFEPCFDVCRRSGCSNCKAPGFKPTPQNLAKRAELNGRTAPRAPKAPARTPTTKPKAQPRKPAKKEKEVISARGTASRPTAGKRISIADSDDDDDSASSDASDSDAMQQPLSSGRQPISSSARPTSAAKSTGRRVSGTAAAAKAAAGPVGQPRYSYCSGKSPLAAAQALARMRKQIEDLGEQDLRDCHLAVPVTMWCLLSGSDSFSSTC